MKKLSMYVCAALIAASTIVSSCKKDPVDNPDDDPKPVELKCYITQTKENDIKYQAYVYNANNKVTRINTFGDDGVAIAGYTELIYDANGRVTTINEFQDVDKTSYTTLEYNGDGLPSKARMYSDNGAGGFNETAQLVNHYNGSQITKSDIYLVAQGTTILFAYQEYTHANGNIVNEKTYFVDQFGTPELTNTTDYTYDTKKNPYLVLNLPMVYTGAASSKNNVTKVTVKNAEGEVDNENSETYVYTYNGREYPTSTIITPIEGEVRRNSTDYDCK